MNPDSGRIIELEPDQALPKGFVELPPALHPAAKSLLAFAETTRKQRDARKRERQNRRRGRMSR